MRIDVPFVGKGIFSSEAWDDGDQCLAIRPQTLIMHQDKFTTALSPLQSFTPLQSASHRSSGFFMQDWWEMWDLQGMTETETGPAESSEAILDPDTQPEVLVDIEPGVKAKDGANLSHLVPELSNKFQVFYKSYKKYGYANLDDMPVVITSGNDSAEHVKNSYHYRNRAVDLRGKHVPDKTLKKIASDIQRRLGANYWVNCELFDAAHADRDHIHVEYRGRSRDK